MSNEQFPTLDDKEKRAERQGRTRGAVTAVLASAVVGAMFFGPNTLQSYHDAQDIRQKAGPASEYVTRTLGHITLEGDRTSLTIGEHTCSRGARYAPGNRDRYCSVKGSAVYVLRQHFPAISDAHSYAMDALRQDGLDPLKEGTAQATVNGQVLDISASAVVTDAVTYNNRPAYLREESVPALPDGGFLVTVGVAAYTVRHVTPDYPHNDDGH